MCVFVTKNKRLCYVRIVYYFVHSSINKRNTFESIQAIDIRIIFKM